MLVVSSRYTRPLEDVDRVREDHLEWIGEQVAAGRVLAAGRQTPPAGAVILLKGVAREDVPALVAGDPYVVAGVAEYEVAAEFSPGIVAPGLDALKG